MSVYTGHLRRLAGATPLTQGAWFAVLDFVGLHRAGSDGAVGHHVSDKFATWFYWSLELLTLSVEVDFAAAKTKVSGRDRLE